MEDCEILDYIATHDEKTIADIVEATSVKRDYLYRLLRRYHIKQIWEQRKPEKVFTVETIE